MSDSVTVTIPMQLDRAITPNGRAHPMKKHRLQQELRSAAYYAGYTAHLELWEPTPPLALTWTVAHGKGRKRLDDTNAIAALKYAEDGIAAALGVDDRHFRFGGISQTRDPDGAGYIRVVIESAAEEQTA